VTATFPPAFAGTYFFADLGVGFVHNFDPATGAASDFATGYSAPVDLKVSPQGDLFVLTRGDGAVHEVSAVTANTPPTPTIVLPRTNQHFAAGHPIVFGAVASDAEDGRLRPAAFSWQVQLWENGQEQAVVKTVTGRNVGAFLVPRVLSDDTTDIFYRVVLTVTDSGGQSGTASRDVQPLLGSITLRYNLPGLQLTFDGQTVATPFTFTGIV